MIMWVLWKQKKNQNLRFTGRRIQTKGVTRLQMEE
jgi:hypothetical protein